jgi:hypothetical protein
LLDLFEGHFEIAPQTLSQQALVANTLIITPLQSHRHSKTPSSRNGRLWFYFLLGNGNRIGFKSTSGLTFTVVKPSSGKAIIKCLKFIFKETNIQKTF